jgi:hypothetical protein
MGNALQIILGAMELGDYEASMKGCTQAQDIIDKLRAEIAVVLKEHRQDELSEIQELMPRKNGSPHKA